MNRLSPLTVVFYQTATGKEPVRQWLLSLPKTHRQRIGVDIWKAQSEWPIGMPHVKALGNGLHEVRSSLPEGIARTFFIVDGELMILFHGFIKKTQKTPKEELELTEKRRQDYEQNQKN